MAEHEDGRADPADRRDRPGPAGVVPVTDDYRPEALPGAARRPGIRGAAELLRHPEGPAPPVPGRAGALRDGRQRVPGRADRAGAQRRAVVAPAPAEELIAPG